MISCREDDRRRMEEMTNRIHASRPDNLFESTQALQRVLQRSFVVDGQTVTDLISDQDLSQNPSSFTPHYDLHLHPH